MSRVVRMGGGAGVLQGEVGETAGRVVQGSVASHRVWSDFLLLSVEQE